MGSLFSTKNIYRNREEELLESEGREKTKVLGVVVRVSTDMQVLDGDSIEMQQEVAQKFAEEIGGVIHKFYIEEGLSASKTRIKDREKIQELMQDIEDGVVNYVVSYKRDRLFRNTTEHMQFLQFLAEHDCEVHFTARGELQVDLTQFKASGMGKMMESLLSMWAEMESAQTSTRVSDTMISKASKGEFTGGRLPIGYKKEKGKFVPIEDGLETIRLIEDLYISGHGVKTISRYLNGANVKGLGQLETPIPKPSEYAKSETWSQRTVETVLFNPIYTGHLSYNSKKNADIDRIVTKSALVQPIRTLETQEKIFEMHKKKTQPHKTPRSYATPFLLTGILYCGECGEPLKTQTSQTKDGKRYSYYKCGKRFTVHKDHCSMNKIYRKELLEKMVLEVASEKLKEISENGTYDLFKKKIEEDKNKASSQIDSIENRIKTLDLRLKNYIRMTVEIEDDEDLKKMYLSEQRKTLNELNELKSTHAILVEKIQEENEEVEDYEKFLEMATNFHDTMNNASMGIQKQLLENLFSSIHINKEGEVDMKFNFGGNNYFDNTRECKAPSFISLETIRDSKASKDIKVRTVAGIVDISMFTPFHEQFNYSKTIDKLAKIIKSSYKKYLYTLDNKLDINNQHLITDEDIKSHADYSSNMKPKGRWNRYVEVKLNMSRMSRLRFEKDTLPKNDKLREQLTLLGSNISEFVKYIKNTHNITFIYEQVVDEIESIHGSIANREEYLFSRLIKCDRCGSNYASRMYQNRIYFCTRSTSNKYAKCDSPFTFDERYLISKFEEETQLKAKRSTILKVVDFIEVLPDGDVRFHYKKKRNYK